METVDSARTSVGLVSLSHAQETKQLELFVTLLSLSLCTSQGSWGKGWWVWAVFLA